MNPQFTPPPVTYRQLRLIIVAVLFALLGICAVVRFQWYTFRGVVLPPVTSNGRPHPLAAWLIVDNTAIPATFGDYCWHHLLWGGKCVTAPKAEEMPNLATVTIPPNHAPVIVVDMNRALMFRPTVRPWNSRLAPGTGRPLEGSDSVKGGFATFTLQALDQIENQVLEVEVMPSGTRRVTYLWHLNPQP